jgi:hypothetical protein
VIAVRYTIMRIMIFAGFFALGTLLRMPVLWAAVFAAITSAVASYALLAPDRRRLARGLEDRVEGRIARRRAQVDAERAEDDEVEGR